MAKTNLDMGFSWFLIVSAKNGPKTLEDGENIMKYQQKVRCIMTHDWLIIFVFLWTAWIFYHRGLELLNACISSYLGLLRVVCFTPLQGTDDGQHGTHQTAGSWENQEDSK